jgi:hypothetical protein
MYSPVKPIMAKTGGIQFAHKGILRAETSATSSVKLCPTRAEIDRQEAFLRRLRLLSIVRWSCRGGKLRSRRGNFISVVKRNEIGRRRHQSRRVNVLQGN